MKEYIFMLMYVFIEKNERNRTKNGQIIKFINNIKIHKI